MRKLVKITLHFHVRDNITESNTNLELYEWYIIDAQGLETIKTSTTSFMEKLLRIVIS